MSKSEERRWHVVPGHCPGFIRVDGPSFKVSVVTEALDLSLVDSMNRTADAHLIAAAPELLEVLELARKELHACQAVIHYAGGFDPAYVRDAQVALKRIDAAIATAKGQPT